MLCSNYKNCFNLKTVVIYFKVSHGNESKTDKPGCKKNDFRNLDTYMYTAYNSVKCDALQFGYKAATTPLICGCLQCILGERLTCFRCCKD